ncbi:hypothetical protein FGO68_gene15728 [Halteria grandinella]|uniref:Secreted protein n=1 Tax=Halteria grandinella TaxID=5974 RepID=A0A8J8P5Z2_HALGN|nr:hypothetical protein FGO68_gene15728 [Halteria grandinella]
MRNLAPILFFTVALIQHGSSSSQPIGLLYLIKILMLTKWLKSNPDQSDCYPHIADILSRNLMELHNGLFLGLTQRLYAQSWQSCEGCKQT